MATTKYRLAEQILRLLKGNPKASGRIHINDVKLLVEQMANQLLKTEYFKVNLPEGDTIPPNCMIVTYDSVPVTTYAGTRCVAKLPAIPISLPKGIGVYHISKAQDEGNPFIPIPQGLESLVNPSEMVGAYSGLTTYTTSGTKVFINRNLPGEGVNAVMIKLVVTDFATVSDQELLPISADMEAMVVESVYKLLTTAPPDDRIADSNDPA